MNPTVNILGGTITEKTHRYHNGQIYEFEINNYTIIEVNNELFFHYNLGDTFFYREDALPELIKGDSR